MTRHPLPRALRTQTTMRLRTELLTALGEIAEDRGVTRSHLVEQALLAFVDTAPPRRARPTTNQGDLFE